MLFRPLLLSPCSAAIVALIVDGDPVAAASELVSTAPGSGPLVATYSAMDEVLRRRSRGLLLTIPSRGNDDRRLLL